MKKLVLMLCTASLFIFKLNTAWAEEIPTEVFAELPQVSNLQQAPGGKKVAFMSSVEGRKVMVVQNLDGSDRYVQPPIQSADIYDFEWANENRLLVMYELTLQRANAFATRRTETRLMAVNADGSNLAWIVKPGKRKSATSKLGVKLAAPYYQTDIIDMLPDEPNHILLAVDSDFNLQDEVRKIDIRNGKFKKIHGGFRGIQYWKTDIKHELRLAWGFWENERVAYWKNANGEWKNIAKQDWYKRHGFYGFDDTFNHLIVSGRSKHGTRGIYRLNIESGQITGELFADPQVDVDYILYDTETGKVRGAAYTTDIQKYVYFDKRYEKVQRILDKALKGSANKIIDGDSKSGKYLILSRSDREPGLYYQFDMKKKQLHMVTPQRPKIYPEDMAPTTLVNITVRDSVSIPSFLTTPTGKDAKNLPTVVLVHGGPHARDDAHWDYWTQFLANRGYVVLRPNFRGSDGYGPSFENAGRQQWGGKMQEDVTDATKYLINKGIADPNRICIAGASYGGYASLMGLIQEPDLYQCGVSVNGVTNLVKTKQRDSKYLGSADWRENMGLEGTGDSVISPYQQAKKINKPILLMSSKDDTRLDYTGSESLHARLKGMGKNSQYVKISDGGHSMDTANSRLTKLKAMEKFLTEHIGE